jgi:hypothetical protein
MMINFFRFQDGADNNLPGENFCLRSYQLSTAGFLLAREKVKTTAGS